MYYFKFVGNMVMALTLVSYIGSQICTVMSNIWLTKWSNDANSTDPDTRDMYLGVYGGLGFGQGEVGLG